MFDAVVIPGGGVRDGGVLPPWVAQRFDRAIERAGNALFLALSAGTPYRRPPLDSRGLPISEARAGAAYLIGRGIDPRRILLEESSYDTLGNAYFSRVVHAAPRGFARMLVITSSFHLPRVEAVFRWVYGLNDGAFALEFESTPDAEIGADALRTRIAKERASLVAFEQMRTRIGSLAALHDFLFTEHGVYAAARREPKPPADLSTY